MGVDGGEDVERKREREKVCVCERERERERKQRWQRQRRTGEEGGKKGVEEIDVGGVTASEDKSCQG